jgi:small nuclear ribonucleoprotein (snRNP)-like protein
MPRAPKVTLVSALEALLGATVTVELRNEMLIEGLIETVDPKLRYIVLVSALVRRPGRSESNETLEFIFLSGRNIRFIHLPENLDIDYAIKAQVCFRFSAC